MNYHTRRERQAADFIVFEAIAHAKTYDPVDALAAATGIILTAFELLTPGMTQDQRRELFLREDKESMPDAVWANPSPIKELP